MRLKFFMKVPINLTHKPVIVSEDYDLVDGRYANDSDAKALSIGIATWKDDKSDKTVSAKIWRNTQDKWSRQSEEMPLHRALDLAILICRAKIYMAERHQKPHDYKANPKIDRIPLQGSAMNVAVCNENESIDHDMQILDDCLHKDDEILGERLRRLSALLKELGY